jgi:hypothetical protein
LTSTFTGFAGQSCDDAGGANPNKNAVAIRKCARALMMSPSRLRGCAPVDGPNRRSESAS